MIDKKITTKCDVCIVGAGPAGLACLSAIRSPYSLDSLTEGQIVLAEQALQQQQRGRRSTSDRRDKQTICVVDSQPWMQGWKNNFDALNIQFLRSPALAHPNLFDQNALLAYAQLHGREQELIESGCFDISKLLPLGQSQIGLWKLPSTKLFVDFCQDMVKSLPHDFAQSSATDINPTRNDKGESCFEIILSSGESIVSKAVILAMGTVGKPIVPRHLADASRIVQWYDAATAASAIQPRRVLVVGGGLTAVQTSQKWAKTVGVQKVVLCSRRPLVERHFDIGLEWFDRRTSNKCMSDFYHRSVSDRLDLLKSTRGGGSVPPLYMRDVKRLVRAGKLQCVVGEPFYKKKNSLEIDDNQEAAISVTINDSTFQFDLVVLACGVQPDCESHPLLEKVMKRWPVPVHGGFPSVTEDMEWTKGLFVAGALGSLNLGPDAGNLMGAKRSAQLIANALSCRSWLRESDVLQNRFSLFWSDSESDEDEDDE